MVLGIIGLICYVGFLFIQPNSPVGVGLDAYISTLSLPEGYTLSVKDVNSSFLSHQTLSDITLEKDDTNILHIDTIEVSHSLFNNLKIFFGKKSQLNIAISGFTLDFDNMQKEATTADNSQLDLDALLDTLEGFITSGHFNIDSQLPAFMKDSSFSFTLQDGSFYYANANFKISSLFNRLTFLLSDKGIVSQVKLSAHDFWLKEKSVNLSSSQFSLDWKNDSLLLDLYTMAYQDQTNNQITMDTLQLKYSLKTAGQILIEGKNFSENYQNTSIAIAHLQSVITTNLRDFSASLTFTPLVINTNEGSLQFDTIDFQTSYVNKQFQLIANDVQSFSLDIPEAKLTAQAYNAQLVLLCKGTLPYSISLKIPTIDMSQSSFEGAVNNFSVTANGVAKSDKPLIDKDDLLSILRDNFSELNIFTEADLSGFSNTLNEEVGTNLTIKASSREDLSTTSVLVKLNDISTPTFQTKAQLSFAYQGVLPLDNNKLQMVETKLSYGSSLNLNGVYSFTGKSLKDTSFYGKLSLKGFAPLDFGPFLQNYVPSLTHYLTQDTKMWGTVNVQGSLSNGKIIPIDGQINGQLALNNAKFSSFPVNVGMTMDALIDSDVFTINTLSLGVLDYRFSYTGEINVDTAKPQGTLKLDSIKDGSNLMTTNFLTSEKGLYSYDIVIPPSPTFLMTGTVDTRIGRIISSTVDLKIGGEEYPLNLDLDMEKLQLQVNSPSGIEVNGTFLDAVDVTILTDNLKLPFLPHSFVEGGLSVNVESKNDWTVSLNDLGLTYNDLQKVFSINGTIQQNAFDLNKIYVENTKSNGIKEKYSGKAEYQGPLYATLLKNRFQDPYSLLISLGDGRSQSLEVAMNNTQDGMSDIYFNSSMLSLGSFVPSLAGTILNMKMVGDTNFEKKGSVHGTLNVSNPGERVQDDEGQEKLIHKKLSFNSQFTLEKGLLDVPSYSLIYDNLTIKNGTLSLNLADKMMQSTLDVNFVKDQTPVNQVSSASLKVLLDYDKLTIANIAKQVLNLNITTLNGLSLQLDMANIKLLEDQQYFERQFPLQSSDYMNIPDISEVISIDEDGIKIQGTSVNGNYHTKNKLLTISFSHLDGFAGNAIVNFNEDGECKLDNFTIPTNLVQLMMHNPYYAMSGTGLTVNLRIKDFKDQPRLFGNFIINDLKLKTFWTGDTLLDLPNAVIIANGTTLYSAPTEGTARRYDTNKIVDLTMALSLDLNGYSVSSSNLQVQLMDYVPFFFPLADQNINIKGLAKGTYNYRSSGGWGYSSGDITLSNTIIKYGLDPYPSYVYSKHKTSSDFLITFGTNNSFSYPASSSPILKVTFDKDQKIEFQYDAISRKFSGEGQFGISQGEFFYFKNNFYINDGFVSFKPDDKTGKFNIEMQFSATYRSYDEEGNLVDIILTVPKSPINNLDLSFTSKPQLPIEKVMQLLGQSLTGTGDNSVASVASAATSVATSLGFINIGGLSELNTNIAKTLHLDSFSFRSNIVENVLAEAIDSDNTENTYSSLSKYLDNTTIYMEKYISDNSHLQLMLNLVASKKKGVAKFFADDLSMDLQISDELTTPLCNISLFTTPEQLSIPDVLDNMGFSVTKTIYFR